MPSYPHENLRNEGLQDVPLDSAPESNRNVTTIRPPNTTIPHTGHPYGAASSQVSSSLGPFNSQHRPTPYSGNAPPQTEFPYFEPNPHYTFPDSAVPWNPPNPQNESLRFLPNDFSNNMYCLPQPNPLQMPNNLQSLFRQPRDSFVCNIGPHLIPERPTMMQPSRHVLAPAMHLHRTHDVSPHSPREYPYNTEKDRPNRAGTNPLSRYVTNQSHQSNIPGPYIPDALVAAGSATHRRSDSLGQRRKWDGGASSGGIKRLRNNQGEPSIHLMNDEPDTRRHGNVAEEAFRSRCHDLDYSRKAYFFRSGSAGGPALVKGTQPGSSNGFFSNASNFMVKQPIMMDHSQHNHIFDHSQHRHSQSDQPDRTLLWLKNYIMEGAEFDSSARDPPPRCHPQTRTSIIERTIGWVKEPRREKKMRWIRGHAGVGKSAIVQTVFETLPEENRGGSVFFSRPSGRNNPHGVFPSIAYQLGVRDLTYRNYLKDLMLMNPQSMNKSMKEQFRLIFEEPFVKRKLLDGQATLVNALDGLDECGGDPTRNDGDRPRFRARSSEAAQREIVELISRFILKYPFVPLIWIITSRPERHLQATFGGEGVESTFSVEEIPVDSTQSCKDVEIYLNSEFTRIRRDHDDLITTSPWPRSKDFSLITAKASGLFIFADVVIRFIDESNPIQQLKYALAAISKISSSEISQNTLAVLDVMYMEVVSKVPSHLREPAQRIIGSIVLLDRELIRGDQGTLPLICNVLDIPQDIALTALRHLHSVLLFPQGKMINPTRPRFYHASFRDFLEDESRSHEFSVKGCNTSDDVFEGLMKFSGRESLDDSSLPWPGDGYSQLLLNMAQRNRPFHLLHFKARIFSGAIPVSGTAVSPHLLNYDFTDQECINVPYRIISLKEDQLQIHEQCGIACRKNIDSLGITCVAVSGCRVSEIRNNHFVVSLDKVSYFSSKRSQGMRHALCRWIEAEPERLVRVWGRERFKRSVVIVLNLDLSPEAYPSLYGIKTNYTVTFIGF